MKRKWINIVILIAIVIAVVSTGYWIYQKNINKTIHAATTSFMEEIAAHDHQNMLNQMKAKRNSLNLTMERLKSTHNYDIKDICYDLNLEVSTDSFESIYIITEDGNVYSQDSEKTSLEDMNWHELYLQNEDSFIDTYSENMDEQANSYIMYGIHLETPIICENESVSGIVGFVSANLISEQLRIESSYNEGIAVIMKPNGETITSSRQYNRSSNYMEMLQLCKLEDGYTWDMVQSGIANNEKQIFCFYPPVRDYGYYTLIEPLNDPYNTGWFLIVQISEKITITQVTHLIKQSMIFFLLIGIACVGFAMFGAYKVHEVKMLRVVEQTKTNFLTNMSHEIRTPLNGIAGLCYLMQENIDDKEQLETYLKQTIVSASFLKDIINDVLDMSKIEIGKLQLVENEINLSNVLSEINELLYSSVKQKNIDFTINSKGLKENWIIGDEVRIKQILMNLLGNAVKFTPEGGKISLEIFQTLEKDSVYTTFIIQDNGCGMSKEFLNKIWSPFEQERKFSSQNGTGLGTSIAKALVNQMNGNIIVDSTQNVGTTFTIAIPFSIAAGKHEVPDEKPKILPSGNIKDMHILVAEDNDVNRMILTRLLKNYDCQVKESTNGQMTVDFFEDSPEYYYDVILMDLQMPVMDGYEASRQIRRSSRADAKTVTILAVTANAFQEDLNKALEAGMDDVITKPIDVSTLLQKIEQAAHKEKL